MISALILFFATPSFAANPPATVTRASYSAWLSEAGSATSPYLDRLFDWYELQLKSPLPAQVKTDPDKLFVDVDRALADTIALETSGDVEEGTTIGFDAYGIIDVPIETALATKLFNWGKPLNAPAGETYPFDSVFGQVHNVLTAKWGDGNYFVTSIETNGGIAQSLYDEYTILVRGDKTNGFTLFTAFFAPANTDTATTSHFSVVMLKPTPDGKTEFRQGVRQAGQSYKAFGLEFGRKNFGFNMTRDRQGEKELAQEMNELKTTGHIKENRP